MNPHLLTYVKRVLHVPVVQVIEYDVDVYMVPNWLNNFLSLGTDIRRTVGKESRPWSWPKVLERAVRDKEFRDCLEVQLMMGVPTNSVAQWIRSKGPWL